MQIAGDIIKLQITVLKLCLEIKFRNTVNKYSAKIQFRNSVKKFRNKIQWRNITASSEFEAREVDVQIAGVASRYHKVANYS